MLIGKTFLIRVNLFILVVDRDYLKYTNKQNRLKFKKILNRVIVKFLTFVGLLKV